MRLIIFFLSGNPDSEKLGICARSHNSEVGEPALEPSSAYPQNTCPLFYGRTAQYLKSDIGTCF